MDGRAPHGPRRRPGLAARRRRARLGWLAVLGLNVTLTVTPRRAATWIAGRTGIEALPLLLVCVSSTASLICLPRMVRHLWGDHPRLPWAPASLPFGAAVIVAQLLAFAATPHQIGTPDPAAATAIPVPHARLGGLAEQPAAQGVGPAR